MVCDTRLVSVLKAATGASRLFFILFDRANTFTAG